MNTIVISIINPSYCSYLHQLNANYGAPPCIVVIIVSGCGPFGSFHCQTRPDGPARISPLSFYASYQKIIKNTRWCPPVISWFINPMNTIVISIINPSEIVVINQLNANYGAPPCIVVLIVSGCGPFGSFHCQTRPTGEDFTVEFLRIVPENNKKYKVVPPSYKLVYKPHEYYSYKYNKP